MRYDGSLHKRLATGSSKEEMHHHSKKRRLSNFTTFPKSVLLNSIPVSVANQLYQEELARHAGPQAENGCIPSNRETSRQKNGNYTYPMVQIPKAHWPEALSRECQKKGQYKVAVHQLAWRSSGHQVPDYESNQDIVHTCGRGKPKAGSTPREGRPCINRDRLAVGTHGANMAAQGCSSLVRCFHCCLLTRSCQHQPPCIAGKEEEEEFVRQGEKGIKEIVVFYSNGEEKRVTF